MTSALVALSACAALPRHEPDVVPVEALHVDFPAADLGELLFTVRLPLVPPQVERVTWELFVEGVPFAAGVEGQQPPSEVTTFTLRAPLPYKHLQWKEGEATIDARLRGSLEVPGRRFTFRERRTLTVRGRPLLNVPVE